MTNYPTIDTSRTPWTQEEVVEYLKCHVTGDLYQESEMILDSERGVWFHKDELDKYVADLGLDSEDSAAIKEEFKQQLK